MLKNVENIIANLGNNGIVRMSVLSMSVMKQNIFQKKYAIFAIKRVIKPLISRQKIAGIREAAFLASRRFCRHCEVAAHPHPSL
jgi:hypothetical protein